MRTAFEDGKGMHLIQYRPHHNCRRVARFCGHDFLCEDAGCDSTTHYELDDGQMVPAGHWIAKTDDGFEVVDPYDLIDYITGTANTWLEA